jgi:hypothetical protein
MQLNLPIFDRLADCRNILIAGMGGGFDVFSGLPIYFALQERGQRAHLANLTFSITESIQGATRLSPTLVGISAAQPAPPPLAAIGSWLADPQAAQAAAQVGPALYFPEYYLSQWFQEQRGQDVTIWCFDKTGVRPLLDGYHRLIDHLAIDGIVLIDGGVDSLVCGDESEAGTFIEDSISLAALAALDDVPVRILGCIGLGAEQDIAYAHILENIAALAASGDFLGACSLVRQMPAYQAYESAVLFVQGQPLQDPSVISSSIISAARGQYGDYHLTARTQGSTLWISPLMALYWFFELPAVAAHSRLLAQLSETNSFREAMRALMIAYRNTPKRPPRRIPLP